jgi:hypothetical protein
MKKILMVLFLVFVPVLCWAGASELVMVKGQGVPVCEAHFKNLRSLELNEMVCERDESYPEENGITRPEWAEVDLRENKELIKRMHKFFSIGDQFGAFKLFDDEKEFESYFNDHISKYDSLRQATVDIGNNGKPEIVMLYREPRCDVYRNIAYNIPYSRALFVFDKDKNIIDIKNTEPLLQNSGNPNADIATKVLGLYQIYDIFSYNGQTYFDKWNVDDWTLSVYIQSKDKTKKVCNYKYKELKNKGGKQ